MGGRDLLARSPGALPVHERRPVPCAAAVLPAIELGPGLAVLAVHALYG
ncbi:hypothetical protein [Geodermatophilus normandii]|uniref:Uncharacterized protein n=1 Tax=Geodermatophilus normandii TaxID=1137989 RepID=A0A6P0GM75_9ACTN|nr:hypothetical protein [Geodermatophilus normandii]NEM06666.1 hypothetical protein [Geodermatophilus normandii]NEM08390.1 hypothetical protein [Geodermatophilus normandii]